jgi:ubiquinone/menaquinone biosynthesis C-methylase UbiE
MSALLVRRFVTAGVGVGLAYVLTRQCRKPTGWVGRRVARAMNLSHARLTRWGLEHVPIAPDWRVLDVGCGGGQTIATIAAMTAQGRVDGVDYSAASVAVARETNVDSMRSGRVTVQRASVSHLPFADATFDLVIAVETHYYWPDVPNDLREIYRVLKPGGRALVVAETYKGRSMDWLFEPVMRFGLRATYLTLDEHRRVLGEAGFAAVTLDARPTLGWMCALGTRPSGLTEPVAHSLA